VVPRKLIDQIPEALLTWPVPGMLQEKVEACLKALPKEYRRLLQPLGERAQQIARELKPTPVSFFAALTALLKDHFQLDLPQQVWERLEIPRYLKMRISVINEAGQEILSGRDLNFH